MEMSYAQDQLQQSGDEEDVKKSDTIKKTHKVKLFQVESLFLNIFVNAGCRLRLISLTQSKRKESGKRIGFLISTASESFFSSNMYSQ